MGNCSFKGVVAAEEHHRHCRTRTRSYGVIRVLSDSGRIFQFRETISVGEILTDFPGFGVFRQLGRLSFPLSGHESLVNGQLYFLLPLSEKKASAVEVEVAADTMKQDQTVKTRVCTTKQELEEDVQITEKKSQVMSPARMSSVDQLTNGSALEVLPSKGNGVWRVKLVIDTKQLEEIFSEQVNTEALIEKMRSAASLSSDSVTPRSRKPMGGWGGNWKPALCI